MLGVQMLGRGKVIVKEFPDPSPKEGEVLIKVKASGLCGSELGAFRGAEERPSNTGHEVAGVVVDATSSSRLKEGDRVGVHAIHGCGKCRWCMAGQYTFCDNLSVPGGTHAELIAVPDHVCLKLPDEAPFDVGVLLTGDGIGLPYHVSRKLNTRGGEVVCIIGAGPVGLGNIIMQSFLGTYVIAVDINDYRLSLAEELGAAETINPNADDLPKTVEEITKGVMADKCILAVGIQEAIPMALKCIGKGGSIMVVGEYSKEVPIIPSRDLIRKDISLMGVWYYHYSEYPHIIDFYRRGLPVEKMITDHFPLKEAQAAFDKFAAGKAGKVILEP